MAPLPTVIPTSVIEGVVDIAERSGVDPRPWFHETGVSHEQLSEPHTQVSFEQTTVILRRALRTLPTGPIGMQVGGRDVLRSFGIVGFAIRSCSTGAEALAVGLRWHQAAGSLMDVAGNICGDVYVLEVAERSPESELLPFLCEEAFCSTLLMIRAVFGREISPIRLELSYPAPYYVDEYRNFFSCPTAFGCRRNRMFFPAELLDANIPTFNALQRDLAIDAARKIAAPADYKADIVVAVEGLVSADLRHPITIAEAAQRLHMSERSLHRKLAAVGERFSDVRDRLRRAKAIDLLRDGNFPVYAVAREIGYSDAREFRRAFIRWTGQPPSRSMGAPSR